MGDKWGLGCGGMGRPPVALGTAGAIRIYKTNTGYRARVLVRDYDGHVRTVERNAASKVPAERALKLALRDRTPREVRRRAHRRQPRPPPGRVLVREPGRPVPHHPAGLPRPCGRHCSGPAGVTCAWSTV